MPSQTQQLLLSRRKGDFQSVDRSIKKRLNRKSKGDSSPNETDTERIIDDYAEGYLKDRVINKTTAKELVENLMKDSNLANYIRSNGKENFIEYVFDKFADENKGRLLTQEIKLKTKTIMGYKVNTRVYLRNTKVGIRAYKFKDNRFAKMPKNIRRKI